MWKNLFALPLTNKPKKSFPADLLAAFLIASSNLELVRFLATVN